MAEREFIHSPGPDLPGWVPDAARAYLAHTEYGQPIRQLARDAGIHASTVLRQVRRIETRRDDPLVDAALRVLGGAQKDEASTGFGLGACDEGAMPGLPDEATLAREARRVLRRLCESGAVLAVAAEMDKAVVVRDTGDGGSARTAVVDAPIAQAMALKDWIACEAPGRISRYRITATGRTALSALMAQQENRVRGFAEAQAGFDSGVAAEAALEEIDRDPRSRKGKYLLAESPLTVLSRRRDKDGTPFLPDALVLAGERLREDFELAQTAQAPGQSWDAFVAMGLETEQTPAAVRGSIPARVRLSRALRDLGPGLGDVALRCCCYLEGLEAAEKALGWSARSGKIVLRIALQRLKRHYEEQAAEGGDMIG
ncbi:DUF6456 domain-containing protein [Cognatishimia sp. F0-27]|uniref:DUF6456 domain-containing protein n=1 Tax=Cognatishimia sp. F0-27 TaxID=2816855 RepID=UPI001D0C73EF|nr:DUF6456 domain-containing protein [Cognatishimia sp. F0-27]MCC1492560.1 helix-turn-helix domain-containing protein [Cognatishimia sp. F0-27]